MVSPSRPQKTTLSTCPWGLGTPCASNGKQQPSRAFRTFCSISSCGTKTDSRDGERFEKYFQALSAACHAPKRSMVCVKAEAYRLLRHVLSFCVGESEKRYPIRAGVEYLKLHWNENTPVSELATLCGMSECYFRRLFGKFAGMNPVRYRTLIRISAAKSMLSAGGMSVAEVAEAVGFEDCFYFSRVFKIIVGVSPSVYVRNPQK